MNIIILHPHLLYPGGASKYMLEIAERLAEKGLSITIILTKYNRNIVKSYKNLKFVEIMSHHTGELIFWLTFPLFFIRLKKVLDGIDNKILFPQIFPPVWWACIYKIFVPTTKIVWMCQEPSAFIHSSAVISSFPKFIKFILIILKPILKIIDRKLVEKIDFIIANSNYDDSLIKQIYKRKADLIAYPAVDPKFFCPQSKKDKYIFTISRLDKQKNIDLLIKAYFLLSPKIRDEFSLFIGGSGKEEKALHKLVSDLNLESRVTFLGRVEDKVLPSYYAKASIVVFLGENEPFGIVPVEAMSCGTPVIALKTGGVIESVIDKKTGILLSLKNEHQLAKEIENLLTDQKLLNSMSKNARSHVLEMFSWKNAADQIDKFFKNINAN